jgi:hypothetical protein
MDLWLHDLLSRFLIAGSALLQALKTSK